MVDLPCSGRPRTASTERNTEKINEATREDRRATVREIATHI